MEVSTKIINEARTVAKQIQKTSTNVKNAISEQTNTPRVSAETWRAYTINSKANLLDFMIDTAITGRESLAHIFGTSSGTELKSLFSKIEGGNNLEETFFNTIKLNNIRDKDILKYIETKSYGGSMDEAIEQGLYTKEELLKSLMDDVLNFSKIKKHKIFEPYNLSLSETSEISEMLKSPYFSTAEIANFLEKKNSDLFEILGGYKVFDDNLRGSSVAFNSLKALHKNIHGENAIKHVIDTSAIKDLGVKINGEAKSFLYIDNLDTSAVKIPSIKTKEIETLIKSNMLTTDLLENKEFIKALKNMHMTPKAYYDTPNEGHVKVHTEFDKLVNRVLTDGIDSLNSNEIHSLTDMLENAYIMLSKTDSNYIKKLNKTIEPKGKQIYKTIEAMKNRLVETGKGKINDKTGFIEINGYEFGDHFFMRMIDRNLANLTDNKSGKIYNLGETLEMIAKATDSLKPDKTKFYINNIHGHGVKIITKKKENGQIMIDSIMQ